MSHFVSATCKGERCRCGAAATHKLGEEIPPDDPLPNRHELTAYVCCRHFAEVVGIAASPCKIILPKCEDRGCHAPAVHAESWYQGARYWCEAHTPWSGHYENCLEQCRKILYADEKMQHHFHHGTFGILKSDGPVPVDHANPSRCACGDWAHVCYPASAYWPDDAQRIQTGHHPSCVRYTAPPEKRR